jgi:hypothetical protein
VVRKGFGERTGIACEGLLGLKRRRHAG